MFTQKTISKAFVFSIFIFSMLLLGIFVAAQNQTELLDEIDDFDGSWETVIEQLNDSGYLDELDGEIIFEDDSIVFEDDSPIMAFDFEDISIADVIIGATLQLEHNSDSNYSFCMLFFLDEETEGFLLIGNDSNEDVSIFQKEDKNSEIEQLFAEEHGGDVDDKVHIIIVSVQEEMILYVNGELFYSNDELEIVKDTIGLARSDDTECMLTEIWVWNTEPSIFGDIGSLKDDTTTYYIKGSSANLRADSNTNSSIVGSLDFGSEIQVIDTVQGQSVSGSTTWYEISYKGDVAYIHSSLVSSSPPPTAAPKSQTNNTSSNTSSNTTNSDTSTNLSNQSQPTLPPAPAFTCNCSKTCSAMASCEEAYYQLNQCGCGKRDSDGDGVPCESICPGG